MFLAKLKYLKNLKKKKKKKTQDLPADEKTVDVKAAKAFADSIKAPYFETSAKANINVTEAFHSVVKEMSKNAGKAEKKKKKGLFGFGK